MYFKAKSAYHGLGCAPRTDQDKASSLASSLVPAYNCSMADLRIFDEPFDRVSGTIREQLYISCLRSEFFGDVYATHAIERVDLGENNFRACSVMKLIGRLRLIDRGL